MNKRIDKITKQQFFQRLGQRDTEDIKLLKILDQHLVKKRGWIVNKLQPGEKVILTLSGGLDSIVAWGILMETYGCEVYPLHVATKNKPQELVSVKFFEKFYRQKYPDLYHNPKILHSNFLPNEFSKALKVVNMHPEAILLMLADRKYTDSESNFFWGTNTLSVDQSLIYKEYLRVTENVEVKSIVCGVTAGDGVSVRRQTLTYLRLQMLQGIVALGDTNLQIFSLFFEPENNVWISKADIIMSGVKMGLPLWRTYSCYVGKKFHCGKCMACMSRQAEFKKAEVVDLTKYVDKNKNNMLDLVNRLKVRIKNARKKIYQTLRY